MKNMDRPKEEEGFSLSKLETKEIRNFRLHVETKMILDRLWRYFEIYLVDEDRERSAQPIVGGVYSIGGGSRLETPWMGLSFLRKEAYFAGEQGSKKVDLLKEGVQYELWKCLVELAPRENVLPQPGEFAPFTNESLERLRELARDVGVGEGGYILMAKGHPHPLAGLQAEPIGEFRLVVLWRKTKIGGTGFTIYLRDGDGIISQKPLVEQGLFRGHALDFYYNDTLTFPVHSSPGSFKTLDLSQEALDEVFYKRLSDILTPQVRVYVAVVTSSKSPLAQRTDELLTKGYPPEVTPLGALLIRAGFWGGFYDYFTYGAEGGAEGPMKLGAQKPLDPPLARLKLIEKLKAFLAKDPLDKENELALYAHRQAQQVLDFLEGANL